MAELRPEWACTECTVRCFKATGEPFPAPTGWDETADRCLSCAKRNEDPEDAEDRARRMVLEGKKTNEIARSCRGTTKKRVNEMRNELIASGDLDPSTVQKSAKPKKEKPPPKPRTPDPKRAAAEELLRTTPAMSNKEIADLTGATFRVVGQWRRKLGIATSDTTRRAEAKTLMAADPTLCNVEVQERMRYPVSAPVVRKVRLESGVGPLTTKR